MQKPDKNPSSKKENKKVQTDNQFKDDDVQEGKSNSIRNEDSDIDKNKELKENKKNSTGNNHG